MNTREITNETKKAAKLLSKPEFAVFKKSLPEHLETLSRDERQKKVRFVRSRLQKLETLIRKQKLVSKRLGKADKPKMARSDQKIDLWEGVLARFNKVSGSKSKASGKAKTAGKGKTSSKAKSVRTAVKKSKAAPKLTIGRTSSGKSTREISALSQFKKVQRRFAVGGAKRKMAHSRARTQRNQKKRDAR
jgi:hypothetical protein